MGLRKCDLAAICLLLFVAVFSVWLGVSGTINAKELAAWQPLMAAVIALGAGTLAYRGALAKVDLDRAINQQQNRRRERGTILRLRFAMLVMARDADQLMVSLFVPKEGTAIVNVARPFRSLDALDEAWANLDVFPGPIAERILEVKSLLFRFDEGKRAFGTDKLVIDQKSRGWPGEMIVEIMRKTMSELANRCEALEADLAKLEP